MSHKTLDDDSHEKYQLHFAAEDGDIEHVKRLVECDEPIDRFDELGFTPLHYAVKKENFDVVRYFLNRGIDINIHDEEHSGETPLGAVASSCSYKMAIFLIQNGANPTIPGWMQLTALYHAQKCSKDDAEAESIIALIENAANKFNHNAT